MYAYEHDPETGGLLLLDKLAEFSKEPRPVYAKELDILGFDAFWKYERQDDTPYLWAESNFYWYRGRRVAKTIGGTLYEKPAIELEKDETGAFVLPEGSELKPVDLAGMIEKNQLRLASLEQLTIKKIYDAYHRYDKRLDCFHVAFSGGKDSIVLLELVKRALPRTAFMVVFGDTGMEFPDTYKAVAEVEKRCREDGIAFYTAKSVFDPMESWDKFGPPSRVLRWCCSVHKSVPQTLKIREVLGKQDYTGIAFVGVRAHESDIRAQYEEEMRDRKVVGQRSFNAILEWSSAEVWLYTYWRCLVLNEAYKYGNQRAGCIYCPMSLKTDYVKKVAYPELFRKFEDKVLAHYTPENLANGYWRARTNGATLKGNKPKVLDLSNRDELVFEVPDPATDLREWLKTLGETRFKFQLEYNGNGYVVRIPFEARKRDPVQVGKLKALINKSAYCVSCGACAANCRRGAISFSNGLKIDNCIRCQQCNCIDGGCHVFHSLKFPTTKGESKMKTTINCFHTHAPKSEWMEEFFSRKAEFFTSNGLGPDQISNFRAFLRAAKLIDGKSLTDFAEIISGMGWSTEDALSLQLINLAYNPQINWYIKNLCVGKIYSRQDVLDLLSEQGQSSINARMIVSSYKRTCDLPLGKRLNFGNTVEKGKNILTLSRTKPVCPSESVFLYGLYRFAEACGGYYEFSLSRLLDFSVESEGVSPAEIFALSRDEVEPILNGLARTSPEFISFTTTHDLELVKLADDKKSAEVLTLFK